MDTRLKIIRHLNSPVDVVFSAWTQTKHLNHWHAPKNARVGASEINLVVGGHYRIEMLHNEYDDCDKSIVSGKYLEIELNKRLVYTWGWEGPDRHDSLVTVKFIAK